MSRESLEAFFGEIAASESFREEYKALLGTMAEKETDKGEAMAQVVRFGAEAGHEFTAQDLMTTTEEMEEGELSDLQLEAVAGGRGGGIDLHFIAVGTVADDAHEASYCLIVGFQGGD